MNPSFKNDPSFTRSSTPTRLDIRRCQGRQQRRIQSIRVGVEPRHSFLTKTSFVETVDRPMATDVEHFADMSLYRTEPRATDDDGGVPGLCLLARRSSPLQVPPALHSFSSPAVLVLLGYSEHSSVVKRDIQFSWAVRKYF
ncbi:hypothetical protein LZ30DRAFT_86151 [Colletotrichum cereale]|nr:hypothetical protein LZ30DRAFT_86151 [Colletotrichum cereale]